MGTRLFKLQLNGGGGVAPGSGCGSSTGGLCRDGAEAAKGREERIRRGWTWTGRQDAGLVGLGRHGEATAAPLSGAESPAGGPQTQAREGPYHGRPRTGPAHFLFREPLFFSLSADRCFFTFSSFLFLLCTFSYTSSLCLQGGGQRVRTQGQGSPAPAWGPHLTGEQTEARKARTPALTAS